MSMPFKQKKKILVGIENTNINPQNKRYIQQHLPITNVIYVKEKHRKGYFRKLYLVNNGSDVALKYISILHNDRIMVSRFRVEFSHLR